MLASMKRRTALAALAGLPGLLSGPALAAGRSGEPAAKKGWAGGEADQHKTFGAKWYYTWSSHTRPSREAEFVPMVKGRWALDHGAIGQIKGLNGISHLLGYNEPERQDQGNLSIEDGIKRWPELVALAEEKKLLLGSPAPSSDDRGMNWLAAFMRQAKRAKLRVDFIAVHWYRSRDAGAFESFVKELARAHRLPVWITEFNGWSGPEDDHYRFLKDSLRFLERSKDVARYAYFEPGKGQPHSLFKGDGSLSRLGEIYRDAGT
jgi:hypothetical protein